MAANEASRVSSEDERSKGRPEEESTPIAKVRELAPEFCSRAEPHASTSGVETPAAAHEQSLDALERAADGIRPSWHGTELGARSPESEPAAAENISVALPPPPPLPAFESFSFDPRAPQYSADSTVRTAALLPERLAHLLKQPQIAKVSHWLSARPWLGLGIGVGAALLLLVLLWPSAKPAPDAPRDANASAQSQPPLPALPTTKARAVPSAPAAASSARTSEAAKATNGAQPPPVPSAKRRDKRAARAGAKPIAGKAREPRKTIKAVAPAR